MKTQFIQAIILTGVILTGSVSAFGQKIPAGAAEKARTHHEIPDNKYLPPPSLRQSSSPYKVNSSGFFTSQVNVGANGLNILGDAANEPSIAVDPKNPNNMVIGWRQFDNVNSNFRQAGYAYSSDGGQHWTFPGSIDPMVFRSDPVVDFDTAGNFYYNSLTANGSLYTCKVFKSTNGGASWDAGTDAHGGDKQWMTIDRTSEIGRAHV